MSSSSTPTKPSHQNQQSAVTPEEEGGNSSRRKRKQEEEEVEPNHRGGGGDNGGSESTPTKKPNRQEQQQQQNAVTPEEEGGNSSRCPKRKQEEEEEEVEPNHPSGDNGGSESTNAPSEEDNDNEADESTVHSSTTVNDEIYSIVTERLCSGNVDVVIQAMRNLRNLFSPMCNNFEENRKFAFGLRAPFVVVQAMSRHEDSYAVQGYGCTLLAGIIPPTMTDHVEQDIIDVGGLSQCLVAMDRYIEQPRLQVVGCKLIGMLWRRLPKIVIQAGGPGAVARAMVTHKQNAQVQQFGFYALNKLLYCGHDWANTAPVVDPRFIELAIGAMERHRDDVYLQREGCKSLCAFAKRHEVCRDRIIKCKGLAAVCKARRIHNDHLCVLFAAEDAIEAISGLV